METYAETVGMLSQQCQHLLELGHPERFNMTFCNTTCTVATADKAQEMLVFNLLSTLWDNITLLMLLFVTLSFFSNFNSEHITKQQSHVDRLYVSLKDMVEHRKTKLEQQYWLYQLNKDVEELEKWITEREAVASSTELGQDLEDVTVSSSTFIFSIPLTTGDNNNYKNNYNLSKLLSKIMFYYIFCIRTIKFS